MQEQGAFFRSWALNHWHLVDRLAQRRFANQTLAEEAALQVMEDLAHDDWQVLRKYRGAARLQTYFSSVVYNLLEDFARQRFGRVRPPLWLKRLGSVWLQLYQLLCLERHGYADAVNLAADRFHHLLLEQIERMADRILGEIPSCGQAQYLEESLDEQDLPDHGGSASVQSAAEEKERQRYLAALHDYFFGELLDPQKTAALEKLTGCRIDLEPEERLLLKLCHSEGFSVTKAGKRLGLNRFQVHGKMRRLYKRLRQSFESAGCGEELRRLLQD